MANVTVIAEIGENFLGNIEIAKKLIQLIENPGLIKKMGENNLFEAKEKYDVQVVSKQIGKMYQEIMKREN